jgi:hypothetical protein
MLVFVTPHQFVEGICKKLVGKLRPGAEAISLIKGMEVKMEGPCMISKLITDTLGINCCVLMGANIANEVSICSTYHVQYLVGFKGKTKVSVCASQCRLLLRSSVKQQLDIGKINMQRIVGLNFSPLLTSWLLL